ncbi:MAG: hypothetical protein M1570_01795 [Chloroflexi bacterium]|nr:hypothetical protein [Chloroflexota bacterium]
MEQTTQFVVVEAEAKENAPELAAHGTLVAFATIAPTTEYSTEQSTCQVAPIPTLEEIEAIITGAARQRIETTYREAEDTRARIERERTAREVAIGAIEDRVSQTKAALAGLADERAKMEERARAFLAGEELKAVLEKIHLAFNAKQLELETALTTIEIAAAEARVEVEASSVTDALELQLVEQELERLEGVAPEVASSVRLTATAAEKLAAALQALQEGMIQNAEVLLEQAKAGNADPARIAEVEQALGEARKSKFVRDLIARVSANRDQLGAVRRIHQLMEEARQAGVADQVAPFANKALDAARDAANARFAQARPIADHLAAEGFIPVVGDGRIEVWKEVSRNGNSIGWLLDRILTLRGQEGWVTETPRNPIARKELPPRVRHSRWFRNTAEESANP